MRAKVKSALAIVSEALETAAGYAIVAVGLYAVLFIDLTGNGSLWKTLHHAKATAQEGLASPDSARVVKVPTLPAVEKIHEDRILAVFDAAPAGGEVAAVYQAPETVAVRPAAAMTDTPADPQTGKTWKKGIKGDLRNFTVYGSGEQTTSAVASRGASAAPVQAAPAAVPTADSPARAETSAASRPGVGSRLSRGALSAADVSRNVR